MKKITKALYALFFMHAGGAYAWVPCMPICSSCSVGPWISYGANAQSGLMNVNNTQKDLNDKLGDLKDEVEKFQDDIVDLFNSEWSDGQKNREAIDAMAKRISFEILRQTKAKENLTDHLLAEITDKSKKQLVAKEKSMLDQTYTETSRPASGVISTCKTTAIQEATVLRRQLARDTNQAYKNYNNAEAESLGKRTAVLMDKASEAFERGDRFRMSNISTKSTMTEDEIDDMNWMVAAITNSKPVPYKPQLGPERELKRRVYNGQLAVVQEVLVQQITDKSPIMNTDWMGAYTGEPTDEKISLFESIDKEVNGRLQSPGWYQNISQLTSVGVSREYAYLMSMENKIMYELLERKNDKNRLLATLIMSQLNTVKPH